MRKTLLALLFATTASFGCGDPCAEDELYVSTGWEPTDSSGDMWHETHACVPDPAVWRREHAERDQALRERIEEQQRQWEESQREWEATRRDLDTHPWDGLTRPWEEESRFDEPFSSRWEQDELATPVLEDQAPSLLHGDRRIEPSDDVKRELIENGDLDLILVLKIDITDLGRVQTVAVLESSGYPAYDDAVAEAVKSWVYLPAIRDGAYMAATIRVTFKYHQLTE